MYHVWYVCLYRPVWYESEPPYSDYAAAVAAAVLIRASGRPAAEVRDDTGRVLYRLP